MDGEDTRLLPLPLGDQRQRGVNGRQRVNDNRGGAFIGSLDDRRGICRGGIFRAIAVLEPRWDVDLKPYQGDGSKTGVPPAVLVSEAP